MDIPDGSHIHYEASTEIGGRLATLGAKLMQGTAHRYADKFFVRFAEAMAERTKEVDSPPPA